MTTLTQPTGCKTVRLADIPLKDRLRALNELMAGANINSDDAIHLLDLVLDPGDLSARIAA